MNIDTEKLRKDLIDYFGTAMYYNKLSIIDLTSAENCSDYELIEMAINNGFDLDSYINNYKK